MTAEKHLDPSNLQDLLVYDRDTGDLFWQRRDNVTNAWNAKFAGKRALCTVGPNGYLYGSIFNRKFNAHRVIWALVHGEWPEFEIDHINGDRSDNRFENLRHVTTVENRRNMARRKGNKSGVVGVNWDHQRRKWVSGIGVNGKRLSLGRFDLIDDAIAARSAAEKKYGFHENHGRTTT